MCWGIPFMTDLFEPDDVEAVVGDDQYVNELEALRDEDFADRSYADVLELNRARYVAAGDADVAGSVRGLDEFR